MEELKKAIKAGLNGYKAMTIQVFSLMWLRTVMNYQYKNGGTFKEVLQKLYKEGGIPRFYSGLIPGLIQGPLCRFGDTFSNAMILNLLGPTPLPIFIKTVVASCTAGIFRIIITPVDTLKTMKQVEGGSALTKIKKRIKEKGLISLYDGALANGFLAVFGHFPWFVVHNYLDSYFPMYNNNILLSLIRNAFIGFTSSLVSDTISNSIHVLKTAKQTGDSKKNYLEIFEDIRKKDGLKGIFFRGLSTRLMINCIQGITFNVLWKYFGKTNRNISVKMISSPSTNSISGSNNLKVNV